MYKLIKNGRPIIFTEAKAGRLVARAKNTVGLSIKTLGSKNGISEDTISKGLKRNE